MKANGCSVTGIDINPQAAEEARAHCEEIVVADLDTRPLIDLLPGRLFDAAVFGDILEHLRDPWRVLEEARSFLGPNGFAVLSIPNIAHGAVRLALLRGAFQYSKIGLLDDDHLRFFTLHSVRELCLRSGYRIDLIDRTKQPLFAPSDLVPKVDPADFHPSVIAAIESDPEHDTLQFIVRASPVDDEQRLSALVDHALESENLLDETQERLKRQTQELAVLRYDLEEKNGIEAVHALRIATLESELAEGQGHGAALESALTESRERIAQLELDITAAAGQQSEFARTSAENTLQRAALESALTESRERIAQLELDITAAAGQQAEFARTSAESAAQRAALESALAETRERIAHLTDEIALADEQRKRDLAVLAVLSAEVTTERAAAESISKRLILLEKDYRDRAALESALAESRERIAHLTDEIVLADERRKRDLADLAGLSAEVTTERAAAESISKRLISLEKSYRDVLEDFTTHTAKELEETRNEVRRVNELTEAIRRSPFWSLKTAVRRLSHFGRD
jgi:predicted  nucleic acid-binding Zn-ribbon protein